MEIAQVIGLAIIVTVLGAVLKQIKPEIAIQLSILAGVTIFLLIMDKIRLVVDLLQKLADQADISSYYLFIVLKIVGVAYLAELGGQICRDAGENALATKVEIAAKVFVVILAIPIIAAIMESMMKLLA
ncbi:MULTISPECIES: stage III sporulation protein AD [Dehalobacter]|jgi:stage III sporulation protein AD|uniref:Stage III sporulation protein AD n=2 Tax=Dehalobacter restrictus TaxID=55583 RepID=A0A857DHW1_9FIRM|nr:MULTISPECIES: stage III sporulation protein AD [Dehalobacter]AHF09785.1 stage III sporulation protein AD [Dehalobacter restrictus DSM 9455]MCG1026502.1 stage III sporulation protein AD [Dehalobacter sp.]OCZ52672.1 stage III sporulation protein AD [Dehalobacter sp. TeCB1]QHA00373.1 stage III sporulation protein AD [Dehalobacter restrictus]RJE48378.1 stage III sporulation protein AD [Dehalobacter sp. MCB1]